MATSWLRLLTASSGFTLRGGKWCRISRYLIGQRGTPLKQRLRPIWTADCSDPRQGRRCAGDWSALQSPAYPLEYLSRIGCGACPSGGGRGAQVSLRGVARRRLMADMGRRGGAGRALGLAALLAAACVAGG